METIIIISLFLFVISIWRIYHHRYEALKYRYRLFKVRDKLRKFAIDGKIDPKSWIFNYYDDSISKNISNHYYITLFTLFALSAKHTRDDNLSEIEKKVKYEVEKSNELNEINSDFMVATFMYIINQHNISWNLIIKPFFSIFYGIDFIAKKVQRWASKLLLYPETSDSQRIKLAA